MRNNWSKVRLGDVLQRSEAMIELQSDVKYRQITLKLWGKGVVLRGVLTGAEIAAPRQIVTRRDQFILSRIDARNGALGIVPPELDGAIVSNDFPVFNVVADQMLPAYLGWICKTAAFVEECQRASEGTTNRVRLQEDRFLAGAISLPPVAEQQRVVARIEALAARIQEAGTIRQQSARQTEALLASNLSSIFEGVKGWTSGKLGDYVIDACYGTSEKTTDDDTGIAVLRMGNIQSGQLDTNSLKYLHLSEKDRVRLRLIKGDILVNRTNSAELVGKCAVFDLATECSFASYLIRLRIDQGRADPRLVAAYINSPLGREYMLREKRQMTGQANVNATKLKALPIALPPLPEQRRIVAYLDHLQEKTDALKALQAETSAELDALVPSILDKAFRGEL